MNQPTKLLTVILFFFISSSVESQHSLEDKLIAKGHKIVKLDQINLLSYVIDSINQNDTTFFKISYNKNERLYFSKIRGAFNEFNLFYENERQQYFYTLTPYYDCDIRLIKNWDQFFRCMYEGYYFDYKNQIVVQNVFSSSKSDFAGFCLTEKGEINNCSICYTKEINNVFSPDQPLTNFVISNSNELIPLQELRPSMLRLPIELFRMDLK